MPNKRVARITYILAHRRQQTNTVHHDGVSTAPLKPAPKQDIMAFTPLCRT
jgi:hypothetical protein